MEGKAPASDLLSGGFENPPATARPWVYWFWINGNISKEGITADLESFQRVGVGGVLWMEVSGPWWAPDGEVTPLSPRWHEAFQWAVRECQRLGIEFDVTLDFGYGSGGPHITPRLSMQKFVWSDTEIEGGGPVNLTLDKPRVEKKVSAWLRPGAEINESVLQEIQRSDSFRDVAVVAIPLPASQEARAYRIADMDAKTGLHWNRPARDAAASRPPPRAVAPTARVIDLTDRMDRDGRLIWDAPAGKWSIIRCASRNSSIVSSGDGPQSERYSGSSLISVPGGLSRQFMPAGRGSSVMGYGKSSASISSKLSTRITEPSFCTLFVVSQVS